MDRKGIPRSIAPDMISSLPEHILVQILKALPLRDAVRTSILSKEWRNKWLTIPVLIFDGNFLQSLHRNYDPESIVSGILAHHKGAILNFTFWDQVVKSMATTDRWLHYLSSHPVEDLHFMSYHHYYDDHMQKVSSLRTRHVVPDRLFNFNCLERLSLKIVELKPPLEFKGFHKLVNLKLEDVFIEPKDLRSFISKCPVLESLCIVNSHSERYLDIDIDAPNLKSFSFLGQFSSIYIENSKIEEVRVFNVEGQYVHVDNYEIPEIRPQQSNLITVFCQLPSIKELVSNNSFLQYLAVGGVPQELTNNLNNLKSFRITYIDCGCLDIISCTLCLFRSSPNLQTIDISFENGCYYSEEDERPVVEYLKLQQKCKIPLAGFEYMKIGGFAGSDPQEEFLKLLLLSGISLKRMEICTDSTEEVFQSAKWWVNSVRASSAEVQIVIVHRGSLHYL